MYLRRVFIHVLLFIICLTSHNISANNIEISYSKALEQYYNENYTEALEDFLKTLYLIKNHPESFNFSIEEAYYNLGVCYHITGKYDEAISCFNKVLLFPNKNMYCKTCINLGNIYQIQLDFVKAINYYKQAEYYFVHNNADNMGLGYSIFNNLGNAYNETRDYNEAIENYKKSIALAIKNNIAGIADTYMNIAPAYEELGDIPSAHKYYNLAIKEYKKDSSNNITNIAWAQMNYGNFCSKTGERENGLLLLNQALSTFYSLNGNKDPLLAYTYYAMGDVEIDHDVKQALSYYQKALIAKVPLFNNIDIYYNPKFEQVIPDNDILLFLKQKSRALIKLSKTENKQQNLQAALATLELTTQLIENLHKGYQLEQSRLELIENEKSTYSDMVLATLQLYQLTGSESLKEKAFLYAEKTKYATLKAQMRDVELIANSGIPDSLRQKEKDLRLEINQCQSKIKENKQTDSLKLSSANNELERELFTLYEQQDRLVSYFEANFPKYFELKYSKHHLEIKDIQKKLSRKNAVVEYFLADTSLVIFVLTKNKLNVVLQETDSTFASAYKGVVEELIKYDLEETSEEQYYKYINNAFAVYSVMFKPILPEIKDKQLIVVPDPALSFLPIGALISGKPDVKRWEYNKLPFLIKEYTISYVYSVSFISNKRRASWNNSFAAFTPSYTSYEYKLLTNEEVESISRYIKPDLYIDSTATEQDFLSSMDKYDIVHLNMHTDYDSVNNNIRLLFTETSDSLNDGKVNYFDIYNLESKAKLVSLSACRSGYGQIIQGEGVISLARSFHYAGCETSITSLWALKDYSSKFIMPEFYKHITKGNRLDIALQKAKLQYIEEHRSYECHPGFWSGIVCIGNPKPVFYPKKTFLLAFLGIIAVSTLIYIKKKKD